MRGREPSPAVATLLAGMLTACAANPAPDGWLAGPEAAGRHAYGGWIELACGPRPCGRGELIAVEPDKVVLVGDGGPEVVPIASVTKATLATHSVQNGTVRAWGTVGTLSAVSHGVIGLLTIPLMWLPAAFGAAADESRGGLVRFPKRPWSAFRPYARFPQGLPKDLDLAALRRAPPIT